MKVEEHQEYEDITYLLKLPEWRAWENFIHRRICEKTESVLKLLNGGKEAEAVKVSAVIEDLKRQLKAFKNRPNEIENGVKNS